MRASATPSLVLAGIVCALSALAQPNPKALDPNKGAWIYGTVISDQTGQPLTRAEVILRPAGNSINSVLAETDERGKFVISRAGPGAYTITAQRDGYLPCLAAHRGPFRMPPMILLKDGTQLRDITFRMRPWAVIAGKVKFDDTEPAVGASVQLYRETINRGRHSMQLVTSTRTNDRGEYRVHGLSPGAYYISASRNRTASPGVEEQTPVDEAGRIRAEFRYATTFYPSAQKLADAMLVQADSGQEIIGIDIYLKSVATVHVSGHVINGLTGLRMEQPNIVVRRVTANGLASISVPVSTQFNEGRFLIKGLTSGPYLVTADGAEGKVRIFDRQYLNVTEAPIDDLQLVLAPERPLSGFIRVDDSPRIPLGPLRVSLEPRSDLNPSSSSAVNNDGSFDGKVIPGEVYDAYVANLPDGYYVKSVRLANLDVGADGIAGHAASPNVPLILTLSSHSAKLQGRAYLPDGSVAGGATILVVPDPIHGRLTAFQAGSADEYGVFRLNGIPPGRYTAFAFYDEPPCDIYDEHAMVTCRTYGRDVVFEAAAQQTLELRIPY
jgi:hypothetical protein